MPPSCDACCCRVLLGKPVLDLATVRVWHCRNFESHGGPTARPAAARIGQYAAHNIDTKALKIGACSWIKRHRDPPDQTQTLYVDAIARTLTQRMSGDMGWRCGP
jgi:hypothetical protein